MDYYDKYTTDLLREKYLPLSSSYDKMWVNDGNIRNRGFRTHARRRYRQPEEYLLFPRRSSSRGTATR